MNNQPLQNSAPSQIPALTSIRGVLAFWVVVYHFWNDLILLFPFCEYLTPIVINGHLAVPAFFILSGTVLSLNYFDKFDKFSFTKYKSFLQSRLARIYPIHGFYFTIETSYKKPLPVDYCWHYTAFLVYLLAPNPIITTMPGITFSNPNICFWDSYPTNCKEHYEFIPI